MYKLILKRVFDFSSALFLIITLSPLIILLYLSLLIGFRSNPVFSQIRPGLNERPFRIYKFRTMNSSVDKNGVLLPDNERITKIGRFLRKSSLDELPELFNILIGNMSFIGPRPLLLEYLPYYTNKERVRHSVRPGITGLAQVSGRNRLNWDRRFELDQEYVRRMSFSMDLKILIKTFANVLIMKDVDVVTTEQEGNFAEIRKRQIQL